MVAPIDAKSVITVDGEDITLRLCFRTIALGEAAGVDLFADGGIDLTMSRSALLVKCLAAVDHPAMTEDQALAVVVRYGGAKIGAVILNLIARFGGAPADPGDEGKEPAKKPTRKRTVAA